jgi:FMN phosphatase YigB (HAD superfamily)
VPANGIRREAIDAFGACWIGCLEPCPGALEAVKELRERGYRMGLASNCWTPAAYAMPELERQGFAQLLHGVTLSCDVGRRKPAEAFYEAALRAVGVSMRDGDLSRVLFVGDAPIFDVAAPAALGMKTALVRTPPGTWPAEHYERIAPAVRVDAIAELLPHLPRR